MVKRRAAEPDVNPPSVAPAQAIELLRRQIEKGQQLLSNQPISGDDYQVWEAQTRNFLIKAFGFPSRNVSEVMDVGQFRSFGGDREEDERAADRAEDLKTQIKLIEGLIEVLETEVAPASRSEVRSSQPTAAGRNHAFLVHGHNEAALHEVARFLQQLGLKITVLREQPNQGRTIIEKFVDLASDVGFAVVLLTPDDRGGPMSATFDEQRPRARQNVILELGFFLGILGRKHVCALYGEGVEIPSDYQGVLFVPLDAHGAWKLLLAREMKAAGLEVDLNRAV